MTVATYSCLLRNSTWLPICFHPFPCPEPPIHLRTAALPPRLTEGLRRGCCGVSSNPDCSLTCWLPGLHVTSTLGKVPVTLSHHCHISRVFLPWAGVHTPGEMYSGVWEEWRHSPTTAREYQTHGPNRKEPWGHR